MRNVPGSWPHAKIENVCRVVSGSTPISHVDEYWGGDITWITPTDLGKLSRCEICFSSRSITKAGYESCATEFVPAGSVILSSRAPIGHLGIATIPLCINQGCKAFVPGSEVESRFLYYALKHLMPDIKRLGSGATFAEVSKSQLERFVIPVPSRVQQKQIADILDEQMKAVEQARAAAEAQLEATKALTATWLRVVFESSDARQWQMKKLGEVLILRKDIVHPRDNPTGRAIFVGLEHIGSLSGRRIGSLPLDMSLLTGRKPRFYRGDIVYGYLRPYLNKVWIADFDGLCSVDQYVYSVSPTLADTQFLAWFMRSPTFLRRAPVGRAPAWLPRIRID